MNPRSHNPLRQFREMEHLSQKEMANACGLSRLAYLRTEQGVFNEIPPSIMEFVEARGYSSASFAVGYRNFIRQQRTESFGTLEQELPPAEVFKAQLISSNAFATFLSRTRTDADELLITNHRTSEYRDLSHPFIQWRLYSGIASQVSICTMYCVHPAHLSAYELRANYIHTPPQLISALRESGYAATVLDELDARYITYRKHLIVKQTTQLSEGAA